MAQIIVSEDCGNSPKNILLRDLTIAFVKRDAQAILQYVTDNIRWRIIGNRLIEGQEDLVNTLNGIEVSAKLTIDHILSHGKAGAVNGTRTMANGKTFAFCDVYEFSNAKGTAVKEITSYVIEFE